MIKEIFELLRRENQLKQAFERSREMLSEDHEMFEEAVRSLRERDDARLAIDVYAKDQMINAYEREVRRKVLTHLVVAGKRDLNAGLILVSVIIDIERIGDYTKNIVELALHHPERLDCGPFEEDTRRIETTVRTMFRLLIESLPGNDEDKAREVMSEHWWISKKVDDIIKALLTPGNAPLSSRDSVTTALYVRYLKRISAHLKNVASSVVNPFDQIGYRRDGSEDE